MGYGDDARIEARSSKIEIRVSSIPIRASIRVSTTINFKGSLKNVITAPMFIGINSSRNPEKDSCLPVDREAKGNFLKIIAQWGSKEPHSLKEVTNHGLFFKR